MKYLLGLILIITITVIGFYIFKNPKTTEINQDEIKIIAFGDSLTAGYGVELNNSYPAILEKELLNKGYNVKILNMGISGDTTEDGLKRIESVLSQNPDLIILGLGANDMLRSKNPSITKDNLEQIIIKIKANNIKIILAGMESTIINNSEYKKKFNSIYKELSDKYELPLIPYFLKGVVLKTRYNIKDGIHPNKEGYEKIVDQNVLPVVLEVLR